MIYKIFLYMIGYTTFYVDSNCTAVLNMLSRENIFTSYAKLENNLLFTVPLFHKKKTQKCFKDYGLCYSSIKTGGLPVILNRYKCRLGIIAGLAILVFLPYLSSNFVWKIDISGTDSKNYEKIYKELEKSGFALGSYIPSIDTSKISAELVSQNPDIAWMSINIMGSCAEIRVKDTVTPEKKEDFVNPQNLPSSLVALCDGYIERIELENGKILQGTGSSVRKGQMLVSGAMESQSGALRLVRSKAKVYARTEQTLTVEIPLERQITRKNPVTARRGISFFNRQFYFSKAPESKTLAMEFDSTLVSLGKLATLPFGLCKQSYFETEDESITLSREDGIALAQRKLAELLDSELAGCETVAIDKNYSVKNNVLILTADIVCIRDIAVEKIIVTNTKTKEN